jgi:hypothetical protein
MKIKERKDLVIKHTTTTTTHIKPVIFVVISLLAVALIYSSSASYVFATSPDPCFGKHSAGCPNMRCDNDPQNLAAYCCWTDIHEDRTVCQTCGVNTDTGEFENCSFVSSKGKPDSSVIAPPPSGVAPPPSTNTCPENTVLDANGNCAPVTQGPKESPSRDQGTTQPPSTDDNKPSKPKLPKGDILKLQP